MVGAAACAYALLTGHSPAEVALSGQRTLPVLATDPAAWSTGALVALVVFKAVAYGVSLGRLPRRCDLPSGPASAPLAVSSPAPWHQDWRCCPGCAIGMAAGAAVIGLPVTSVVLVVLLLGDAAVSQMPVVILAVVAAMVVDEKLSSWFPAAADAGPHH